MVDWWPESSPSSAYGTAERAISFISKGWSEVRASAGADLQLMRARANSFKTLADRELEQILSSATAVASTGEAQTKLDGWSPKATIRIDLSSIRNAIVSEVDEFGTLLDPSRWPPPERRRRVRRRGEGDEEWELIRRLKSRLKEFERKSQSTEIFGGFIKSSDFVEKVKLSLGSIRKEAQESKEVPPLDLPELLAYLVKQSSPLFDQLGIRREICDKLVKTLYSWRKDQLDYHSFCSKDASLNSINNAADELDLRIASVLQSTGHHYEGGFWTDLVKPEVEDQKHHVAIVTTASLPWMTGTAINPLFRAAYLAKSARQDVTLVVPWLCKSDQELVYPNNLSFDSPEEQEAYIRKWLEERIGFKTNFKVSFYPGKFAKERRSIIPVGDTTQFIPSKEADIAILEEPEHLNWYHHGKRWTDKFNHVVGIVHTNYLEYIKREKNGAIQAFFVRHINNLVARAHCHKVLRLSAATQVLPKSVVCNVHGVNPKFIEIGERLAAEREHGKEAFSKGAYFLGKMVWAKGYKELIDLMAKNKNHLEGFNLDVYGNGEDAQEVQTAAKKLDLNLNFLRGRDHADDSLHRYKVFINPSVSDVLCTATAEALAMGKFVICADHPSNEFFKAFPNCMTYKTPEDFVARVKEAMAGEPRPLTPEQRYTLSWDAATQRFMEYSELDKILNNVKSSQSGQANNKLKVRKSISMPSLSDVVDGGLALAHYCFTGNEILRLSTGAIPGSRDYSKQHCIDLHLLPPQVQHPVYGW